MKQCMSTLLLILYWIVSVVLFVYGMNCHVLVFLFKRRYAKKVAEDQRLLNEFYQQHDWQDLPVVTTQLPIYNELNVAERIIDAVAAFEYPAGKHEIQVLDDSTDETTQIVARKVQALQAQGVWIQHLRRGTREGFKAGALKYGLERSHGEFVTIFDADFTPAKNFLLQTIPFFVMDNQLGFVQGRWGHLNQYENLITQAQAVGINGYVVIQAALNWNNMFMNFNGTAGAFRKQAIQEVGNWQGDTLTEDFDLSYRMQLAGWTSRYLINLVVPAELPPDVQSFKNQQFRWAKGAIQTAIKLLPAIWASRLHVLKKCEATLHLTYSLVHPLILYLALIVPLALPMQQGRVPEVVLMIVGTLLWISTFGPPLLYWVAERHTQGPWYRRLLGVLLWICAGCSLAINNTRAVYQAFRAKQTEFVRTPKKGTQQKRYVATMNPLCVLELLMGCWCVFELYLNAMTEQLLSGWFLVIYAAGFLYTGGAAGVHYIRDRLKPPAFSNL